MPGTSETQMRVRIPYFLLDILKVQEITPCTITKVYSIAGMYSDNLITSEQVDYFIRRIMDPKASEKLQLLKNIIDRVNRNYDTSLKRKKSAIQRTFIQKGLNLLIKSPNLNLNEKDFCEEMITALKEV